MTYTSTSTELVQSLFEAFGKGDITFILQHLAPDCRWIMPGQGIPIAGVYQGREGVAQFFQKLSETEQVLRFEPREYFVNGDDVVALGFEENQVISTGKKATSNWAMLFRMRDGQVASYEAFFDTSASASAHQP
jgi:ketosteroid isomerase-like protein